MLDAVNKLCRQQNKKFAVIDHAIPDALRKLAIPLCAHALAVWSSAGPHSVIIPSISSLLPANKIERLSFQYPPRKNISHMLYNLI